MTTYLIRPEGRIAYDRTGEGPLVVLVPGMGDLVSTYRFLVPVLVAAGFSVVSVDLRGHGDSDVGFGSYGDAETAEDLAALLDELGAPAIVVGSRGRRCGRVLGGRPSRSGPRARAGRPLRPAARYPCSSGS